MAEKYPIVNIKHIFFIHSFVTGHIEWFPNLTIVSFATINVEMQVFLWCDDLESFWVNIQKQHN